MYQFPLNFFIFLGLFTSAFNAQQMYSGPSVYECNNTDEAGPSPAFLYTCNGEKKSCPAFLIFRPQPPYDSVTNISNLTSSDPSELARINKISNTTLLTPEIEVIVPVTCSCSGQYYQANSSYVIVRGDTYYTIARDRYQGLTTCDSLRRQNPYDKLNLDIGTKLQVPLRCACPTSNQREDGINFLLTYVTIGDEKVEQISDSFKVTSTSVAYANGLSEEDSTLYDLTTILIPLQAEPFSSRTRKYFPSPPSGPDPRKRNSKKGVFIGIGTGVSIAILCCALYLVYLSCRRNKTEESICRKRKWVLPQHLVVGIAHVDQECLKVFEYDELAEATENFSPENRLGASVYHGVLRGKMLAIKKMSKDVSKEVKILKKINHFNLISLYGACEHGKIFYLVYELMENGSLKEWLRKKSCPEIQSWNYRIRIALDVANGLLYLHNFTNPAYVHKDINSSNILLDRDLRAKIANFSLARSTENGEKGNSSIKFTTETKGYKAPEYLESNMVTPKMDVYAFGVVLLELITGKEAVIKQDGEEVMLSEAVLAVVDGRDAEIKLQHLTDPCLQMKHPLGYIIDQSELTLRMMKLSVACLAPEPSGRLSMSEVVSTLMKIQMDAQKPEFVSM